MAANCRVYDSRQQQADCQEPGSAPELYPRQQSIGYLYLYFRAYTAQQLFNAALSCTWYSTGQRSRVSGQ